MGQVALSAFPAVVSLDCDLFEPGRTGWIGFVTTNAMDACEPTGNGRGVRAQVRCSRRPDVHTRKLVFDNAGFDIRIVSMIATYAVACLTRESLVGTFGEPRKDFRMTFLTGFAACVNRSARSDLFQCIGAIPPILAK